MQVVLLKTRYLQSLLQFLLRMHNARVILLAEESGNGCSRGIRMLQGQNHRGVAGGRKLRSARAPEQL